LKEKIFLNELKCVNTQHNILLYTHEDYKDHECQLQLTRQ